MTSRHPVNGSGRTLAVAAVTALVLVAGCSGSDERPPADDAETSSPAELGIDPSAPVEAGELPEEGPTDLGGLGPDDRDLVVGEEHVAGSNHTTVLEVRRPLAAPSDQRPDGPGREWVGVRVATCFETDLDLQLEIGSYTFSVVSDDETSFPGIQPADARWPLPQYPGYGRLAPGQCTSGWVAIPVAADAVLASIVQSTVMGDPVAAWVVPDDAR